MTVTAQSGKRPTIDWTLSLVVTHTLAENSRRSVDLTTFLLQAIPLRNAAGPCVERPSSQAPMGRANEAEQTPDTPGLAFKRFQIGDQVADLVLVQRKFGHSRMAGPDTLGKRLLQILDGIPLMKGSERRRFR